MSWSLRDGRWVAVCLVVGICVMMPSKIAAQEQPPGKLEVTKLETALKQRKTTTEEKLRKQLQDFPEAGFDQQVASELYTPIIKSMQAKPPLQQLSEDRGMTYLQEKALQDKRPDMVFLPWLVGPDNMLSNEDAAHLQKFSAELRFAFQSFAQKDGTPDLKKLQRLLTAPKWTTPAAVPTLAQMMQAESTTVRLLLVDVLAKIEGTEASIALAKRAIFDLSPAMRARAIQALATRPAAEYTSVLYDGFRYPWPTAADHAAEAVVALKRGDMIPELVKLLQEPSPTLPVKVEGGYTVQEVVRINHLCNCMLCHAPSLAKGDMVRRSVPIPGQSIVVYYDREGSGSLFVRADLTYLRQDFSVVQPVAKPNKWPTEQRYDYLVRTRPLSKTEQEAFQRLEKEGKVPKSYPQQTAVVFALQELTGEDHGTTYESWSTGLRKSSTSPPQTRSTEKPTPQRENP
jgi:hypothetical protein